MRSTITVRGQTVIPAEIRRRFQLTPADRLEWVHESPELLMKAAEIKAKHRVSFADAWIAAAALLVGATLLHKNPEFEAVPVKQEALPLKGNP